MRAAAFASWLLVMSGCAASAAAPPANRSIRVGRFPVDLAAGDLDGDGHLDLVTADARDRRLSVRLWRRGVWRAGRAVPLRLEPHMLALADLDRDGDLDIAATGHDDPGVHVVLGDGRGAFSPAPGSPFAAHPGDRAHNHGLAAGDLDGDGDIDLATSNQDLGSVSILLGDGTGRFTPARGSPVAVGKSPYPLALADLDGGGLDIVVPLVGGDAVAVLLNDGKAGFRRAPGSPIATVARPYGLEVADLDGDRALDVAAAAGDRVLLLRGDGRGRLTAGDALVSARQSWRVVAADLDGDGRTDLAAPDAQANAIRIRLGRRPATGR